MDQTAKSVTYKFKELNNFIHLAGMNGMTVLNLSYHSFLKNCPTPGIEPGPPSPAG